MGNLTLMSNPTANHLNQRVIPALYMPFVTFQNSSMLERISLVHNVKYKEIFLLQLKCYSHLFSNSYLATLHTYYRMSDYIRHLP
jgi:uncharacterized membrane protein